MVASRILVAALVIVLASTALSACGKKGSLTPPDGSTYPQQYPKQ
jgi:predicted small lipoprotein YifL